MKSTFKSNFKRSQSKVWWGNDNSEPQNVFQHGKPTYSSLGKIENSHRNMAMGVISEDSNSPQSTIIQRRDSPGSLRSQDSGFSDSDHSPNSTNSPIHSYNDHSKSPIDENRNYLKVSPSKLSPKINVNYQINAANNSGASDRSPSICSEAQTPPTVIRKKQNISMSLMTARRISFSAPSSPCSPPLEKFAPFESFKANDSSLLNEEKSFNDSEKSINSSKGNRSLRRGRTITPSNSSYRRLSQRKLLQCVSQVSGSVGDVYTLSSAEKPHENEIQLERETRMNTETHFHSEHIYESVASISGRSPQKAEQQTPRRKSPRSTRRSPSNVEYNNETVVFGTGNEPMSEQKSMPIQSTQERLPLPTYDELYPNGTSTPKMLSNRSQAKVETPSSANKDKNNSAEKRNRNRLFSAESLNLDFELSLSAMINWDTCTYIEYSNPLLNGHASSVQFWLDETRASFCHEILSTLQTKSVLHEAARNLKLNAAIAAKLIHQIQLKALHIEGNFDEVESVFVSHAKASKMVESKNSDGSSYFTEDQFKDIIPNMVKQLIVNVCNFMNKLNSRAIFQSSPGSIVEPGALKKFEKSVKAVVDMSQDLQVACDTKIDDIEAHKLLEDLQLLKNSVLKTIRKIYRRLVNIIVSRIEMNTNELLLQASVNMVSSLPLDGNIYNRMDSFASLNSAFIETGAVRVLLLTCLDTEQTAIRAMALRALATICSTTEMIEQFLEMGGIEVVADMLLDAKKMGEKFETEMRETVSVLTQVTAPWHLESHPAVDEFLRISVDKLVTRITQLLDETECPQTLMLCAACLNNLSRKTDLTFYSLMSNRSIIRLKKACETHQNRREFIDSSVFLYEQITTMTFNMAGNKKCHQHLANKEIINFLTQLFQSQFHLKCFNRAESIAKTKTIKNILHIFARLLHNSAVSHEILENNVIPIFSRVEQNLSADSAYSRDMMYINRKLHRSVSPTSRIAAGRRFFSNSATNGDAAKSISSPSSPRKHTTNYDNQHKLTLSNITATNLLESYV